MLLQVHDELVVEVAAGERDAAEKLVREEMGSAITSRYRWRCRWTAGRGRRGPLMSSTESPERQCLRMTATDRVMHGDGIGRRSFHPRWPSPTRRLIGIRNRLAEPPFGAAAIDTTAHPSPTRRSTPLSGNPGSFGPRPAAPTRVGSAAGPPGGVIRKQFDLFANPGPSRALPGSPPHPASTS